MPVVKYLSIESVENGDADGLKIAFQKHLKGLELPNFPKDC